MIPTPLSPLGDLDDEDTVLGRHLGWFSFGRANFLGECLRQTQRQAVAPSQKFNFHNIRSLHYYYNDDTM